MAGGLLRPAGSRMSTQDGSERAARRSQVSERIRNTRMAEDNRPQAQVRAGPKNRRNSFYLGETQTQEVDTGGLSLDGQW